MRLFLTGLREIGPAGRLVSAPMTAKDPAEKPTNIADAAPPPQTNHERAWRRERQKPNKSEGGRKFLLRAKLPNRYPQKDVNCIYIITDLRLRQSSLVEFARPS